MIAPSAAPASGAIQKSQSCPSAPFSAKNATAVERAGFTEVLVTGIEIRWMRVRPRPIAIGAKPAGALADVLPKMMIRKAAVRTSSIRKAAKRPYPPGELAPKPLEAKPPGVQSPLPEAIM